MINWGIHLCAYVGVFLNNTSQTNLERINEIPFVTVASVTTSKFNIFVKLDQDTKHAKVNFFMIDDVDGVYRTETMISMKKTSMIKSLNTYPYSKHEFLECAL
jgi:Lrp/AsnC family transcriptional regulator for asnA, asnC and gidA